MSSSVFRDSSLDRVSSPEQLNDYIKVSSPSIWMVLAAAIVFLTGVVVWGVFGSLVTKQETVAVIKNGNAVCYISSDNIQKVGMGMKIYIGETAGTITVASADAPIQIGSEFDPYALYLGGFEIGEWVYQVQINIPEEDGVYSAEIITEELSPISFIMN